MVNLSKLNDMEEFEFNHSVINESENIFANIVTNANTSTDGYIGLIILILLYLFFNYILFKKDGLFQLDLVKANVMASGFVVVIGFVMLVSNLIGEFQHVMWFVLIFVVSIISSYFLKKKNL